MQKTDLKTTLDGYRAKAGEFRDLVVPPQRYLLLDGHGDPNSSPAFTTAVETLYPLAYALKYASRRLLERDFVVMPLEGLWWADDHAVFTTARDAAQWDWTLMLLQPDWIDEAMYAEAVAAVAAKKSLERLADVRFEVFDEGRCVQTLHRGPFDAEGPVLARLHDEVLPTRGLRPTGRHHEIYFSDPRRGAPEKRRTILRQSVAAA